MRPSKLRKAMMNTYTCVGLSTLPPSTPGTLRQPVWCSISLFPCDGWEDWSIQSLSNRSQSLYVAELRLTQGHLAGDSMHWDPYMTSVVAHVAEYSSWTLSNDGLKTQPTHGLPWKFTVQNFVHSVHVDSPVSVLLPSLPVLPPLTRSFVLMNSY